MYTGGFILEYNIVAFGYASGFDLITQGGVTSTLADGNSTIICEYGCTVIGGIVYLM
jgi:hypothetical protein